MINTAGIYIMILIYHSINGSGIATQEFNSFEACQAAQVQLNVILRLNTYCIAKDIIE